MTTRETMRRMHDRCFCEQHRDELRDSYRALVVRGDFEEVEAEYTKGKEVLATELNDLQKEWLTEIEELYTSNCTYASHYGFDAGLYTGFQRYFATTPKDKCDMGDVLEDELFTAKGMKRHTEFSARNDRCIELLDQFEQELTEAVFYHVTSVDCAWQERIHFFAVEDYYIGYRTAVEILEHVRPNATGYMVPDTLLIEYELGKLERNDRLEELARREREAKENG